MDGALPEMADVVFAVSGDTLPDTYAWGLWRAVAGILPWLQAEDGAGILPLRTSSGGDGVLLSQRAKLVLRVPASRVAQAQRLSGQVLDVAGHRLSVGEGRERALQPHASLHAQMVVGAEQEESFLAGVAAELGGMGISCKWICGRHMSVAGEHPLSGYSLVLHELKPEDSLRMQCAGLGPARRYGCGIFVPYKGIPNLD